ncbi:MAG: serine/threonine protein kinase, partial [Gemmataceae bacterium]|nr:serine/threonine protein kinase [Gemmataceae bacterium]
MTAPSTADEFLSLIGQSGLVHPTVLGVAARGLPAEPRAAAAALIRDGLLTHFQAEQLLAGKYKGFTLGRYRLLERIGVGGMGQVYLCEPVGTGGRVAVKVLPPARATHPSALGRFYREARAAAALDHPNVVRTREVDHDGDIHFIVMDYVRGPNLLELVRRSGPLPAGRAASYAKQAADGLDYAHRQGIVHRDVKPGNILVDRRGTARVLDLGLARFVGDHLDDLTKRYDDNVVLGTADYVAPEQVADSHAADARADVYALGGTLYYLLAGHPPFPAGTVSQKLTWHRTRQPDPIRVLRPEVPDGLAAVVGRMMAKDPRARYPTPGEAANALARWVPAEAYPPSEEEMPQLCPAALGSGEEAAETGHARPEPTSPAVAPSASGDR